MNKKPKREKKVKFTEASKEYKETIFASLLIMSGGLFLSLVNNDLGWRFFCGILFGVGLSTLSYNLKHYNPDEIVYEVKL